MKLSSVEAARRELVLRRIVKEGSISIDDLKIGFDLTAKQVEAAVDWLAQSGLVQISIKKDPLDRDCDVVMVEAVEGAS